VSTRHPAGGGARAMIYFIIRRLVLTVFLLILVSLITFAIFFLVPRLAGQTTY
jgi:peptide/nickel transport system permease protein